jgi:hypothetical protein
LLNWIKVPRDSLEEYVDQKIAFLTSEIKKKGSAAFTENHDLVSNEIVPMSALLLYKSSKKLERLNGILAGLTGALIFFTIVLILTHP